MRRKAGRPPLWPARAAPTCLLAQVLLQRGQLHIVRVAHGGDVLLQPGPGLLLCLIVRPQPGQALLILLGVGAGEAERGPAGSRGEGDTEGGSVVSPF